MLYSIKYYAFLTVPDNFATSRFAGNSKNYWPVNSAILTGHMTNDVTKRQMSRRQRRVSAYSTTVDSISGI